MFHKSNKTKIEAGLLFKLSKTLSVKRVQIIGFSFAPNMFYFRKNPFQIPNCESPSCLNPEIVQTLSWKTARMQMSKSVGLIIKQIFFCQFLVQSLFIVWLSRSMPKGFTVSKPSLFHIYCKFKKRAVLILMQKNYHGWVLLMHSVPTFSPSLKPNSFPMGKNLSDMNSFLLCVSYLKEHPLDNIHWFCWHRSYVKMGQIFLCLLSVIAVWVSVNYSYF